MLPIVDIIVATIRETNNHLAASMIILHPLYPSRKASVSPMTIHTIEQLSFVKIASASFQSACLY